MIYAQFYSDLVAEPETVRHEKVGVVKDDLGNADSAVV